MIHLNEIQRLENLTHVGRTGIEDLVSFRELTWVGANGKDFPLMGITIGAPDRSLPTLGLFGGVHGLERVGTHVVLAFLESFLTQLKWDEELQELMRKMRIVSIPLVNPVGMFFGYRSNGNGVDLMRNAPVEADIPPPWLVGGHRISPRLPWYRGAKGAPMEPEATALVEFVRQELFESQICLAMDFHSGFGLQDRLWYPYARSKEPFPRIREALALKSLFDQTHPHHVYQIEPQCVNYTTHGDLWDYLFDDHQRSHPERLFIPWTLEMGSWQWVRKNPRQLFHALGPFNPIKPHRYKRVMRRHRILIDFFMRATLNSKAWLNPTEKPLNIPVAERT